MICRLLRPGAVHLAYANLRGSKALRAVAARGPVRGGRHGGRPDASGPIGRPLLSSPSKPGGLSRRPRRPSRMGEGLPRLGRTQSVGRRLRPALGPGPAPGAAREPAPSGSRSCPDGHHGRRSSRRRRASSRPASAHNEAAPTAPTTRRACRSSSRAWPRSQSWTTDPDGTGGVPHPHYLLPEA
jgi:hypothetical protein